MFYYMEVIPTHNSLGASLYFKTIMKQKFEEMHN